MILLLNVWDKILGFNRELPYPSLLPDCCVNSDLEPTEEHEWRELGSSGLLRSG
jgi:hypothetical protein